MPGKTMPMLTTCFFCNLHIGAWSVVVTVFMFVGGAFQEQKLGCSSCALLSSMASNIWNSRSVGSGSRARRVETNFSNSPAQSMDLFVFDAVHHSAHSKC